MIPLSNTHVFPNSQEAVRVLMTAALLGGAQCRPQPQQLTQAQTSVSCREKRIFKKIFFIKGDIIGV